jgi:hypothetical protein
LQIEHADLLETIKMNRCSGLPFAGKAAIGKRPASTLKSPGNNRECMRHVVLLHCSILYYAKTMMQAEECDNE